MMAFGRKTGGRDFTHDAPGPGRPSGSPDTVPRRVKASIRTVLQDIVTDDPALIRDAIVKGLRAPPPKSFPYLQLAAAYVDGKPADKLQIRNYERLTDDELAQLETLLARATSEADDE